MLNTLYDILLPEPSMAYISVRAATGSMRNAGGDEKEDWLETKSVSAPEDGGTPTWKEPSNDKRKLASSFCSPTSLPPPPVRRIFNGKIMRGISTAERTENDTENSTRTAKVSA